MGWENTITEQEMDTTSLQVVQGLLKDGAEIEPDLSVDGFSESILSWIFRILRFGRS